MLLRAILQPRESKSPSHHRTLGGFWIISQNVGKETSGRTEVPSFGPFIASYAPDRRVTSPAKSTELGTSSFTFCTHSQLVARRRTCARIAGGFRETLGSGSMPRTPLIYRHGNATKRAHVPTTYNFSIWRSWSLLEMPLIEVCWVMSRALDV
jgi:hypothetical protein